MVDIAILVVEAIICGVTVYHFYIIHVKHKNVDEDLCVAKQGLNLDIYERERMGVKLQYQYKNDVGSVTWILVSFGGNFYTQDDPYGPYYLVTNIDIIRKRMNIPNDYILEV